MRSSTARLCSVVLLVAAAFSSARAQVDPDVGALTVFSSIDMVSVEGFQVLAGLPFKTEVVRDGIVVGAAWSVGSGGEVAAEVNHAGGDCWGTDAKRPEGADPMPPSLKVTPDIRAGDLIQVRDQNGLVLGGQKVLDATITRTYATDISTFVVEGKVGTEVNHAFLECRIVQPGWVDTFGRRDARAVPGAIVPSAKGGYEAGIDINPAGEFMATFIFATASDRDLAVDGGASITAWISEDANGPLGVTIFDHGELGGPGFGGCPAGPSEQSAPQGSFATSRDGDSVTFTWSKPEVAADAPKVIGYYMAAMEQPAASIQRAEIGMRVMNADIASAIVAVGNGKTYDYEMRSITEGGSFSKAFAAGRMGATAPPGTGGTPPPPLTAKLDGNVVTFEAVDGSAVTFGTGGTLELWYTISETAGGNPATVSGNTVAPNAVIYRKPITLDITDGTRFIHWIVFSKDNIHKTDSAKLSVVGAPLIKVPPTLQDAVIGQAALTVRWATTDTNIATFDVEVYDAATSGKLVTSSPPEGLPKSMRDYKVTGLTAGTKYWFTVRGVNAAKVPGDFAARQGPAVPTAVTDKITISTAGRWRAGRDFRADGTASETGVTIRLCRGAGTDKDGKLICNTIPGAGAIPVVAGVAGASPTWSIRMSNGAVPTAVNPMYAISTKNGQAGPVTLAARRLRRAL